MGVTIVDVAQRASVSAMTVSRVLKGVHVNEKNKLAVEKAIEELGYKPNLSARAMRSNRTNIIGIVVPDIINPFYAELVQMLEEQLNKSEYHLLISFVNNHQSMTESVNYLVSRGIDGIVFCCYSDLMNVYEYLEKNYSDLPKIILDKLDVPETAGAGMVFADGNYGIRCMTELLIDSGCRKIAMITSELEYGVTNERLRAYKDVLREHGMEVREENIFKGSFRMETGAAAAKYFMSLDEMPDGIVAANDFMAIGALQYLVDNGISVPEQVSVAGFDGVYLGDICRPKLTTYEVNIRGIAEKVAELLTEHLDRGKSYTGLYPIAGRVKVKGSTK